jgi:23S rRNA (cytosine1962-C5)-methyltransferase
MDAVLRLKKGEERAWHHPWIFKGEVADVGAVTPGGVVTVVDARGRFVGRGFFNPRPALCCRILTRRDEPVDAAFLARRVAEAVARRRTDAPAAPEAERLVWSEGDGLPGLVVDRYGEVLVVQALTLGMARVRGDVVRAVREAVGDRPVFSRDEALAARLEGFTPAAAWVDRAGPEATIVREGAVRLHVRLGAGHKTGLYLDQAENRARIGGLARGRSVLDAFCYTAGFAVHALAGGARGALCLESSAEALAGAHANLALNGVADRAEVREGNAFEALRALEREGARFGCVVLDPPPFARGRTALADALRGYREINVRAMRLLEPGGVLATFSCSHHVSPAAFEEVCREAAADARATLRVRGLLGQAADHPVVLTVPETRYLKGLLLEAV